MTDVPQEDADILALLLAAVRERVPDVSGEVLKEIELELRASYGGRRHFLPKRRKRMDVLERRAVYQAGLGPAQTETIAAAANIHRVTLYRLMKRPPK